MGHHDHLGQTEVYTFTEARRVIAEEMGWVSTIENREWEVELEKPYIPKGETTYGHPVF